MRAIVPYRNHVVQKDLITNIYFVLMQGPTEKRWIVKYYKHIKDYYRMGYKMVTLREGRH